MHCNAGVGQAQRPKHQASQLDNILNHPPDTPAGLKVSMLLHNPGPSRTPPSPPPPKAHPFTLTRSSSAATHDGFAGGLIVVKEVAPQQHKVCPVV